MAVGMLIIPMHSGILNDFTSHFTGPMVSKSLEILQEVKHREEQTFDKYSFY